MKKRFTILLAMGLGITLSAQDKVPYSVSKNITKKVKKHTALTGLEYENYVEKDAPVRELPSSGPMYNRTGDLCEEEIGYSLYDLQTNQCVQDRLMSHDGDFLAAWTFSAELGYAERGTGYQRREGTAWMGQPDVRIEPDRRTGWPSLLTTAGGKEIVINHPNIGFNVYTREVVGTGDWVETMIPTNTTADMLWPRACAGGADGNTVHAIGITTPVGNGGTPQLGQDGALLYYRSLDQGANWDIVDYQHPGHDSTAFAEFGGDAYALDAHGETVAYAYFSGTEGDSFVMVSEDNGTTFTKRTFLDHPMDLWVFDETITDFDDDGIVDTVLTTDGTGAVHVDADGIVHVTYGTFRYYDDIAFDTFYTIFPGLSGIYYWNSTMADNEPVLIHQLPDDFVGLANYPDYRANPTGMVNMASDPLDTDKLALVFSGQVSDLIFDDTYNYRHIYAMMSTDGGDTWTTAKDVTPYDDDIGTDEYENIHPDVAPDIVDNHIQVIYHRDDAPGVILRELNDDIPDDDAEDNYIRFLDIDLDYLVVGIDEEVIKNSVSIFPNPSADGIFQMEKLNNLEYVQYQVIDLLGKVVYSSQFKTSNNTNEIIDLSSLKDGVYMLMVETTTDLYSQTIIKE